MIRSKWQMVRGVALVAATLIPAIAQAQAQDNRPVIAVWYYTNSVFGPNSADYKGLETGIAELLITDLASNGKYRVVERGRINQILEEQNLTRTGMTDPNTAARLGKLLGACYSIMGGIMNDGKGRMTITGRTVNIETGAVGNPVKLDRSADDIMGLINELSSKLSTSMVLTGCPTGPGRSATAAPAQQGTTKAATQTAQTKAATPAAASSTEEKYAKALTPAQAKATNDSKLDMKTALLYSKALDALDNKDKTKASALLKQVVAKFPNFEPAKESLAKASL